MANGKPVVEGGGGLTFVSKNGPTDFVKQAPPGSIYVEFDVPTNSLVKGGKAGWYKLVGPRATGVIKLMLKKQGGQMLPNVKSLSKPLQSK